MILKTPTFLSGYLLASSESRINRNDFCAAKEINFISTIEGIETWEVFEYESNVALMGEDQLSIDGPFRYPIVSRRSGERVLFLSLGRDIVDQVRSAILTKIFTPNLFPIRFNVHEMVTDISKSPGEYVLTFVHTRVAAFGAALRAASFYGDDIGEANLFRENLGLFSCFTCGLRLATQNFELLRISAEGLISFQCPKIERLTDIETILGFIRNKGYYIYSQA